MVSRLEQGFLGTLTTLASLALVHFILQCRRMLGSHLSRILVSDYPSTPEYVLRIHRTSVIYYLCIYLVILEIMILNLHKYVCVICSDASIWKWTHTYVIARPSSYKDLASWSFISFSAVFNFRLKNLWSIYVRHMSCTA